MSDPSTPEEIRAEAIERIAAAEYLHWTSSRAEESTWDDCTGQWRDRFVDKATRAVDALGDLLPTAVEGRYIGRGLLRRTRYVTDWREPEEG
ncbi:hypothetical protein [Nocardia nova]|uniref:hypothetical protein n=1 Tax=Nocardia nova TaxID=37330 RepID=UPI002739B5C1|nr:hypothetical protein [Nocardia nova]